MKKIVLPVAVLMGLSACGQGVADDELMPGNWKMSAGMTDFEVPGATVEQAEMFKNAAGSMMSQEQCIAEGENKFDPDTMSQAFKQGGDCTIGEFDLSGGTIEGTMSCTGPDGNTSIMAINGTIAPEAFAMSVATEMAQDALPQGKANVTIEVKGERIGDC